MNAMTEMITLDTTREGWLGDLIARCKDRWPQAHFAIQPDPNRPGDTRGRHEIYETTDAFFRGDAPVIVATYTD